MGTPGTLRIAHLSDLHLTATDRQARSEHKLLGKLTGMNQRFRRLLADPELQGCDRLLVTGDVTDRGDLETWRGFWDALREFRLLGRALVLPGNHDVCSLGLGRVGRGATLATSDLDRALAGLRLGRQPDRFPWVRRLTPEVVLFGLESNNAGNRTLATNAVGQLGYHQLLALGAALHRHRDVPVKLVALHHSPNIPEPPTARRRGRRVVSRRERLATSLAAEDRRALRLLCASHRVRLIVHGHLHDAEDRRVNGVRIVGAPASTQPLAEDPTRVAWYQYRVSSALRVHVALRTTRVE